MKYIKINNKNILVEEGTHIYIDSNRLKISTKDSRDIQFADIPFSNKKHQEKLRKFCLDAIHKNILDLDSLIVIFKEIKNENKKMEIQKDKS